LLYLRQSEKIENPIPDGKRKRRIFLYDHDKEVDVLETNGEMLIIDETNYFKIDPRLKKYIE